MILMVNTSINFFIKFLRFLLHLLEVLSMSQMTAVGEAADTGMILGVKTER